MGFFSLLGAHETLSRRGGVTFFFWESEIKPPGGALEHPCKGRACTVYVREMKTFTRSTEKLNFLGIISGLEISIATDLLLILYSLPSSFIWTALFFPLCTLSDRFF